MATLEEMLALLPDNITGEISAGDLRTIVTNLWARSAGFAGQVNGDDGSLVSAPAGWTGTLDDVGVYTVTHDLNLPANSYSVVVTELQHTDQEPAIAAVISTGPTSFTFATARPDGTPINRWASFVMAVNR